MLRREPRFSSDLAVSVIGRDANGNRFKQTARAEDISRHGGRLTGLYCLRAPGDPIEVEYRGKKAAFRIIWIEVFTGRAGIYCTEDRCIWGELPSAGNASSSSVPFKAQTLPGRAVQVESEGDRARSNLVSRGMPAPVQSRVTGPPPQARATERPRRKFPRYRCRGGVAATVKGVPHKLWGQLAEIGLGGCYMQTMMPFEPGTKLELHIGACGFEIRLSGEVRYRCAREGMGIMFTDLGESKIEELKRILARASGQR